MNTSRHTKFRSILLPALLVFCRQLVGAQTADSLRIKIADGWIEKMNNNIALDLSFNNSYETFEVKTPNTKIELYPNAPNRLRFKANYRFISFGLEFSPNFLPANGDDDLKGQTTTFAIGTALIFRHWFVDFKYSEVDGFYLRNTEDYMDWEKGDPYIQFPDLDYRGFSFSSGYNNNERFSLRSLASQTERQLKRAGSFIPVFDGRYYLVDDKSASIDTQKSKNIELSIGPGYAYTFVAKEKFYLSLGGAASLGYIHTWLTTRTADGNWESNQDNLIFRWDGKSGIGYNGSRFYSGAYATISGARYRQENTTAMNFETRVFYHIFVGIRLKSPKFLDRLTSKVEDKLHKSSKD
jgi:hypothetical protein